MTEKLVDAGQTEADKSGRDATRGLPVPDENPMSGQGITRPRYPNEPFETGLLETFPNREDIQDFARFFFYEDFSSCIESYENISNEEMEEIRLFVAKHTSTEQS